MTDVYSFKDKPLHLMSETQWREAGYKVPGSVSSVGRFMDRVQDRYLNYELFAPEQVVPLRGKPAASRRNHFDMRYVQELVRVKARVWYETHRRFTKAQLEDVALDQVQDAAERGELLTIFDQRAALDNAYLDKLYDEFVHIVQQLHFEATLPPDDIDLREEQARLNADPFQKVPLTLYRPDALPPGLMNVYEWIYRGYEVVTKRSHVRHAVLHYSGKLDYVYHVEDCHAAKGKDSTARREKYHNTLRMTNALADGKPPQIQYEACQRACSENAQLRAALVAIRDDGHTAWLIENHITEAFAPGQSIPSFVAAQVLSILEEDK